MVDSVEVFSLYENGLDESRAVDIYGELSTLAALESSLTPDQLRARLEDSETVVQPARYRSVHFAFVLGNSRGRLREHGCFQLSVESVEFDHITVSDTLRRERVADLVSLVTALYEASRRVRTPPAYVLGATPTHVDHLRRDTDFLRTTAGGIRKGELEELYWLQIFPPEMVETVGRSRILSAPVSHVDELADGAIVFTSHERPTEFGRDYRDCLEYFSLSRGDG